MDISGAGLRGLRAALFSALVVLLSTGSHVLLSRAPLPPVLVGGAFAAVFALAFAVAGRERGFGAIAGLLVPLELAADTAFTAGQHFCYGPAGGPVAGPLHALGLDGLCGGAPVGGPLTGMTPPPADPAAPLATPGPWTPWLLLGAHVSAGLLAAAWLRYGERALGRLLRAVGVLAFRPLLLAVASVVAAAGPARRPVPPAPGDAGARTRFPAHSVGRRGPPVRRGALASA
ncbi:MULTISPECIES: hypothetical protein [unclassified Streptomyces]|uniref:hypothetical protein n=1 Tax=unclassified Streptomyces TaxID=2593676 RepID=UPI00109E65CD|nr:hypothetical protein [Streptomyces sp. A1136]THA52084.1 hypothetical protein E6R62_22090 [Streptomyces sp. A1136]